MTEGSKARLLKTNDPALLADYAGSIAKAKRCALKVSRQFNDVREGDRDRINWAFRRTGSS